MCKFGLKDPPAVQLLAGLHIEICRINKLAAVQLPPEHLKRSEETSSGHYF
jgi:hypothetical protein